MLLLAVAIAGLWHGVSIAVLIELRIGCHLVLGALMIRGILSGGYVRRAVYVIWILDLLVVVNLLLLDLKIDAEVLLV